MSALPWSDPAWTQPHWLYRHYDADEALLYVGMTREPERRPYRREARPWLAASVRVDLEGPMSRVMALRSEEWAIEAEEPRHNVYRHNGALLALAIAYDDLTAARHQSWARFLASGWDEEARPPCLSAEDFTVHPPAPQVLRELAHLPVNGRGSGCADCRTPQAAPA